MPCLLKKLIVIEARADSRSIGDCNCSSMRAPEGELVVQFSVYILVSSLAALTNLLVGFSLYEVAGLSAGKLYGLSVGLGYLAGVMVNYSLNRIFTFPNSGRHPLSEVRTFVVIAGIGLLLTVALAAVLRGTLAPYVARLPIPIGLPAPSAELTAQGMAIFVVAIYSFVGHKWLTFSFGIRVQLWRLYLLVLWPNSAFGRGIVLSAEPPSENASIEDRA